MITRRTYLFATFLGFFIGCGQPHSHHHSDPTHADPRHTHGHGDHAHAPPHRAQEDAEDSHDHGDHAHDHGHDGADAASPTSGNPLEALPFVEEPAEFASTDVTVAGTWLFPDAETSVPCVIIAGGTMSHLRDGGMEGVGEPGRHRDALRRLALHLAAAGYASLRWDLRGHGQTPAGPGELTYQKETDDLIAAIETARAHHRVSSVIVAGESAGGYLACLAAERGVRADGYLMLGCLASDSRELFRFNYGLLVEWAGRGDANLAWAKEHAARDLALGHHYDDLFAAAEQGEPNLTVTHDGREYYWSTTRIREELERPPSRMFRFITAPTLVVQGETDMNVPTGDAGIIQGMIETAGNSDVEMVTIPGVDHSFQYAARDPDERMKNRHDFTSFYRLYSPKLYETITAWLADRFPSPVPAVALPPLPKPGVLAYNGIRILDVVDGPKVPLVTTLEGSVGPMINGDQGRAFLFELPPGLFCAEHTHPTESIIYTVRGQYVLCSHGRRHHMKTGSIFWFKAGAPTGWEVPFDEPALILIFKGLPDDYTDAAMWEYLIGMAEGFEAEHAEGVPFRFHELQPDHPARVFAHEINPEWESTLPGAP